MALLDLVAVRPITFRQVGRWLLTILALPFVAVGWCIGGVVRAIRLVLFGIGYSVAWTVAAMRVGYRTGRGLADS